MAQPGEITILVVDDSIAIRTIVSEWLEEKGFDVLTAEDGAVAIDLIRFGKKVDLILLDLKMPNLNGYLVTKLLKGHPKFKKIPIAIITGAENKNEKLWASQSGAEDFILKPIKYEKLMESVSRLLRIEIDMENKDIPGLDTEDQ